MPQEFHVVKCFCCEMFQVQIVKKVNKYTCKICGEKQSVKKEYGRGTGKDCRLHVQKLNELHIQNKSKLKNIAANECNEHTENEIVVDRHKLEDLNMKSSKWLNYLPEEESNSEIELENNAEFANFTFERPNKRRKHSNFNKAKGHTKNKTNTNTTETKKACTHLNTHNSNHTSEYLEQNINCDNLESIEDETNVINVSENKLQTNKLISSKNSKWDNFITGDKLEKTINLTQSDFSSTQRDTALRKDIFKTDVDNLDDILNF